MANISDACISAAKEALKTFNEVDLEKYVLQVFSKAKEYNELKGAAAIDRAIKEVGDERAQSYMEQLQLQINNKALFDRNSKMIESKKARLLDILVRRVNNVSNNVESAQNATRKTLMDASLNILTDDETAFLNNDRNSIEIMRALDGKPAGDIAKGIAKKFADYIDKRNSEEVNSGALLLSNINKDRVLKAIHDAGKILRGGRNLIQSALSKKYTVNQSKELWKNYIKPLLNLDKTFDGTLAMDLNGKIDHKKVDSMLDDIFDSITTGKAFTLNEGQKQEMFFYWKDNEAWMNYNQKYGKGSLLNAWRADIQASSNKIGISNILGSNSKAAYNELANFENEVSPQNARVKYQSQLAYKWLSGADRSPVNPDIASFWATLRGISGSGKLAGRLTLLSLPDIANGILFANRYGYNYFKAYGTYLSGLFNVIKTEERQYIANLFKEMTDTHLGYMSRFIEADNAGEIINNFNNLMYRATFMNALDRGNKISSLQLMARILGDNARFEHGALNDTAKGLLEKFNITDKEWNVVRSKAKKLNGKRLLTIDSVNDLSNDEIRSIYGIETDRPIYKLRNDLHRKIYSMFDVASENTVLTPGAFMKASSNIGPRSGTHAGELLKSMMQFKMYPLEFADRVLFQGMKGADGIQNKLKFAALLFGATLPMSWLSMYLDNQGRGKSMPDWDRMTFGEKVNYSKDLLFPGIGLLGSFLDPNNQVPNKAGQILATPAIQLLWEGLTAPIAVSEGLIEGDQKKIKKAFKAIGKSVIPGQGIPLVAPYMRQMFGDKPYLQPGQKQLRGS